MQDLHQDHEQGEGQESAQLQVDPQPSARAAGGERGVESRREDYLERVARELLEEADGTMDLSQVLVVVPAKGAVRALRTALVDVARRSGAHALLMPRISTLDEWISSITPLSQADDLTLAIRLYEHVRRYEGLTEGFDKFYHWAHTILEDFSAIDRDLLPADKVYLQVKDRAELDTVFADFLEPEQIELIRRFWRHFDPEDQRAGRRHFLNLWKHLPAIYTSFRADLEDRLTAYKGLQYGDAARRVKDGQWACPYERVWIVGFNALYRAELTMLETLDRQGRLRISFDYASWMLTSPPGITEGGPPPEAGRYLRQHRRRSWMGSVLSEKEVPPPLRPTLERIQLGRGFAQGQLIPQLLEKLQDQYGPDARIAIIVEGDGARQAILASLAGHGVTGVHAFLRHGLADTSLYTFLRLACQIRGQLDELKGPSLVSHRLIVPLLSHPIVDTLYCDETRPLRDDLVRHNRIMIEVSRVCACGALCDLIMSGYVEGQTPIDWLMKVVKSLLPLYTQGKAAIEEADKAEDRTALSGTDVTMARRVMQQLNKLRHLLASQEQEDLDIRALWSMLQSMLARVAVYLESESGSSVELLGLADTQGLTFDHLIVAHFNEGTHPSTRALDTFLPLSVRQAMGLVTPEDESAIHAYNLYRLVQGAQTVTLLENIEQLGLAAAEPSRYYYQWRYLQGLRSVTRPVVNRIEPALMRNQQGIKTPAIMAQLGRYLVPPAKHAPMEGLPPVALPPATIDGVAMHVEPAASDDPGGALLPLSQTVGPYQKHLSPSALISYLICPYRFYLAQVLGLKPPREINEEVRANVFGNVLHHVMEELYQPYLGQTLTPEEIDALRVDASAIVRKHLAAEYKLAAEDALLDQGSYLIAWQVIVKYVELILNIDESWAPFTIRALERGDTPPLQVPVIIGEGVGQVCINGIIDRVDQRGDHLRVVDYKTGSYEVKALKASDYLSRGQNVEKEQLQSMLYTIMLRAEQAKTAQKQIGEGGSHDVKVGYKVLGLRQSMSTFRSMFRDPETWSDVEDTKAVEEEFLTGLATVLQELYNPEIPFIQITNRQVCQSCDFCDLCDRRELNQF